MTEPLQQGGVTGGVQREQRLRLRRFFMSLLSYSMWYAIAVVSWFAGLLGVSLQAVLLAGLGMYGSQLVFYILFRDGWNRRFSEPSLTVPQIVVGLFWALVLIAFAREIRGVMLIVYMITLLFGIFAFDKRQFLIAGTLAYLGYVALVVFEQVSGLGYFSDGYYLVSLVVLAGVLLWTSIFGSYVSNLRYRLQARNEELESVLVRLRELAARDDLTGLYNRRIIMDALHRLKARSERTDEVFSICIIDLDHFKQINDRYGHIAGDRVLAEFSEAMQQELRGMDMIARTEPSFGRYGGEEFILVLPRTDLAGAMQCAERLRNRQEERAREAGDNAPACTLSAGVAMHLPGEDVESLLRRADHALYAAKHDGRNRVCAADPHHAATSTQAQ